MRQHLIDLHEIQKIDLYIRELALAQEALPVHLRALEESVAAVKTELAELEVQAVALAGEVKELERSVQQENEKIRKWERRLSDIRNQREYLALSREVEGSKRAVRDNEEQTIELMAKKEEIEARMEELQDKLAEDAVDRDAERQEVEKKIAGLTGEITKHTARREALVPKIKPLLLRKYDQIREKRHGLGVVAANGGNCMGCNMRLPPQLYNILMRADSLEDCPSCQRILIYQGVLDEVAIDTGEGTSASASA